MNRLTFANITMFLQTTNALYGYIQPKAVSDSLYYFRFFKNIQNFKWKVE